MSDVQDSSSSGDEHNDKANTSVHTKRSLLIQEYRNKVKNIEKELKKKKIAVSRRAQLEAELEALNASHAEALAKFDEEAGLGSKKVDDADDLDGEKGEKGEKGDKVVLGDEEIRELVLAAPKTWGGSSKKELMEEAAARGLSKKGTREELASALNLWTLSQAARLGMATDADGVKRQGQASGGQASGGQASGGQASGRQAAQGDIISAAIDSIQMQSRPSGKAGKDMYREKRKKLWKRRGAPTGSGLPEGPRERGDRTGVADGRGDAEESGSENDKDDESGEESGDESGEEEGEGKGKRKEKVDPALRKKREVVVKLLTGRILSKFPEGVAIAEIPMYMEKVKVKNFSADAVGYKSLEEWIYSLPENVVRVDKTKGTVHPPDADDSSDDDDDEDEDSD